MHVAEGCICGYIYRGSPPEMNAGEKVFDVRAF